MAKPYYTQLAENLPGLTGWLLRWRRGEVVVVTVMAVGDVEDVTDHGGS